MSVNEEAKGITNMIYKIYGTGSGCIFGFKPEQRDSVEAIINVTVKWIRDMEKAKYELP